MQSNPLRYELGSLGQAVASMAIVVLVLMGIGGTIYKVIAPDGWIASAFGRSFSAGAAALGSLAMIAALAWFSRGSPRARSRVSDLFLYTFAAAGIVYFAQLWMKGSF